VLADWLNRAALDFEDRRVDVADLVLFGLVTNRWGEFEREVSQGLALTAVEAPVDRTELSAAIRDFRLERRLISGDEMAAWLAARELTGADLAQVLERTMLIKRARADAGPEAAFDDDAEVFASDLAAAMLPEALVHGTLARLADSLLDRLAAAHRLDRLDGAVVDQRVDATVQEALSRSFTGLPALGEQALGERLARLWSHEDALSSLRDQLAEPEGLDRRLSAHRIDWLRLEGRRLSFNAEHAAREARMLLTDDGLTIEAVEALAGVSATDTAMYVDELPASAVGTLAATVVGEVAGPWLQAGAWNVLSVRAKTIPSASDPTLHERAVQELLGEVIHRQAAGRTRRHLVL
jgi:hypothetical protein